MLKITRKLILFVLIFAATNNLYTTSFGQSEASIWNKIKDIDKSKIELIICLAYITYKATTIIKSIIKPKYKDLELEYKKLKDASIGSKNQIMELAKKLDFKNPEDLEIKVKTKYEFYSNGEAFPDKTIAISQDINEKPTDNISKFVFGHELTHLKNKHSVRSNIVSLFLYPIIFFTYYSLNKKYKIFEKIPFIGKIYKYIITKLSLPGNILHILTSIPFITIITTNLTLNNSIKTINEIEADIGSASLDIDVATGGIRWCNEKLKNQKIVNPTITSKIVFNIIDFITKSIDSHPSWENRLRYLEWYKKNYYNNKN